MTDRFEQVATEFAHGTIAGSHYGSQVRVLMRAPDAVLFVGLGLQLWAPRSEHGSWHVLRSVIRHVRIKSFEDESVIAKIEDKFGEGSAAWALKAWRTRGQGTVLVDGGGDPLPLPHKMQRAKIQARHAAVSPTQVLDLTGQIKTCRQCGADLQPVTSWNWLDPNAADPDHPRTLEQCQRLTNHQIVAVKGFGAVQQDKEHLIEAFQTWDGETVFDDLFCNDRCAAAYGRRAADLLEPLPADGTLRAKPDISGVRQDVHYDTKAEEARRRAAIDAQFASLRKRTGG